LIGGYGDFWPRMTNSLAKPQSTQKKRKIYFFAILAPWREDFFSHRVLLLLWATQQFGFQAVLTFWETSEPLPHSK